MQKRLLLEWLRNQTVIEQVVPIVEVGAFFQSPSDEFTLFTTFTVVGNTSGTTTLWTLPADETWLIAGASIDMVNAAGNSSVLCGLNMTRPRGLGTVCLIPSDELTNTTGLSKPMCIGRMFEHLIYAEGGSVINLLHSAAGVGNAGASVSLHVVPVGKNQRS